MWVLVTRYNYYYRFSCWIYHKENYEKSLLFYQYFLFFIFFYPRSWIFLEFLRESAFLHHISTRCQYHIRHQNIKQAVPGLLPAQNPHYYFALILLLLPVSVLLSFRYHHQDHDHIWRCRGWHCDSGAWWWYRNDRRTLTGSKRRIKAE